MDLFTKRIWNLTQSLSEINMELGVDTRLSSCLIDKDLDNKKVLVESAGKEEWIYFDDLIMATDPLTAHSIIADISPNQFFSENKSIGSSGKINLFFSKTHSVEGWCRTSRFRFCFSIYFLSRYN